MKRILQSIAKALLCPMKWHTEWARREGSYLETTVDGEATVISSELRQCALCSATIVRAHESRTTEAVYAPEQQATAMQVFQRRQLLGFEGSEP